MTRAYQPQQRLTMQTKIAAVIIADDTRVGDNILEAGEYLVEMPMHYVAARITAEDILCDDAVRVVREA